MSRGHSRHDFGDEMEVDSVLGTPRGGGKGKKKKKNKRHGWDKYGKRVTLSRADSVLSERQRGLHAQQHIMPDGAVVTRQRARGASQTGFANARMVQGPTRVVLPQRPPSMAPAPGNVYAVPQYTQSPQGVQYVTSPSAISLQSQPVQLQQQQLGPAQQLALVRGVPGQGGHGRPRVSRSPGPLN